MSDSIPSAEERASLDVLGARLAAESPTLSPIELDRLRRRVLAADRDRAPARRPRSLRLVAVTALTVGVLVGGTGVTFGINAIAEKGDAAADAYPTTVLPGPSPEGDGSESRTPGDGLVGVIREAEFGTSQSVNPGQGAETPPAQPAAAARQLAAAGGAGSLAFTGYLALPALALGLLLVATGLAVMRRAGRATGS
jgi:hypothetical protein